MKIDKIAFTDQGWDEYCYWQVQDRKTLRVINKLIDDIQRHPFKGIGKPEPLKYRGDHGWSRRIDKVNRLVYYVTSDSIIVVQCRYHYAK